MEDKIDLKELIRRLSAEMKFSQILLEKDYHLTRILQKISEGNIKNLVFKGGTCLNKCYLDFYRLSEDLDFVYNKDIGDFSRRKVKKIIDELRREFFEILGGLGFKQSNKLGEGWKMLTSKSKPRIVGLEIITNYKSKIENVRQTIKIELSFRKKLMKSTHRKIIHHKFLNPLGEPILKESLKIESIDLTENFAEKFRALVVRKTLAVRDIYDIYYILKNKILGINNEVIGLILAKINETKEFSKTDLKGFMNTLGSRVSELDEKEMEGVIRSDEKLDIKEMVKLIVEEFKII